MGSMFSYPNLISSLYVQERVDPISSLTSTLTIKADMSDWEVLKYEDLFRVIPYGSRQTLLQWGLIPDITPTSILYIQRSDSPESGWITIAKRTPQEERSYLHEDGNNTFASFSEYWYRILVYGSANSNKIIGPLTAMGVADPYGAEIARRHQIKLNAGRSGNLMYLFIRMKEGLRCPTCWDEILQKRIRSSCPECMDTGWLLGYYDPHPIYISIGTERESIDHVLDGSSNTDKTTQAWTANYPILNSGDIIIEPRNRKIWCITHREFSTHRRVITKQNLILDRLDGDDPVWELVNRIPKEALRE